MAITEPNDHTAWQDLRTETCEVLENVKNNLAARREKYLWAN